MNKLLLVLASAVLLSACTLTAQKHEIARAPVAPPPVNLPPSAKDIAITQQIRSGIIADKDMSVNAQNIKIVTRKGQVTLIGAVDDPSEHAAVRRIAEDTVGVVGLNDQLEVLNSIAEKKGSEIH